MTACTIAESSAENPKPSRRSSRYSPAGERQPGVVIGQVSTPTKVRSSRESLSLPPFRARHLRCQEWHGAEGSERQASGASGSMKIAAPGLTGRYYARPPSLANRELPREQLSLKDRLLALLVPLLVGGEGPNRTTV